MPDLLFLGYDRDRTRLIDVITGLGWRVMHAEAPVTDLSAPDLVVSFGYRHILRADVLATARRPVLNLHIAYLPWNRGAHPLFWAMVEGTPVGVTIHEIDPGVDTGAIVVQRRLDVPETETFAAAHARMLREIEALFEETAPALLAGDYTARPQEGAGSVRRARELPAWVDWSAPIGTAVARYRDG